MLKYIRVRPSMVSWDGLMLAPVVVLLLVGLMGLYSTSIPSAFLSSAFARQLMWLVVSAAGVWLLRWVHPKFYYAQAYRLYGVLVLLLVITYFMPAFSGGRRWVVLGPIHLQPAEFGKIILVFALAKYLTDFEKQLRRFPYTLVPVGMAFVPAVLIMGQPDLGTALIYLAVAIGMMFWAGVSIFHIFVILAPAISLIAGFNFYAFSAWMLAVVLILYFSRSRLRWSAVIFAVNALFGGLAPVLWNSMQPYQQRRILTMLDVTSDPHGAGYQVLQSQTAIGSGGVFGKGIGEGTQTHLRFLPVSDTDFIIAVIGEEMGFLAILLVVILFAWLLLRLLDRASTTQYRFAGLSIVGFVTILLVHIFVNMGMATGLLPVTGLPLPFMSYGGSFLLSCLLMVGLSNYLLAGEP